MAKTLVLLDIGTQDVDQFTGTFTTMLMVEAGIDDMKVKVVVYHLGQQPAESAAHCRHLMQEFGTAVLGITCGFQCFNFAPASAHSLKKTGCFGGVNGMSRKEEAGV